MAHRYHHPLVPCKFNEVSTVRILRAESFRIPTLIKPDGKKSATGGHNRLFSENANSKSSNLNSNAFEFTHSVENRQVCVVLLNHRLYTTNMSRP